MRLDAQDVGVRYGARVAVAGVDLGAEAGGMLAILGANGSGKSSLLRALAGVQAHTGQIRWDGDPARPGAIGYMPQDNAVRVALTAFEVALLGRMRSLAFRVGDADLQAARAALAELGIAALAARRIGELSGGQRQLVFLAQVLAGRPEALLLDEPTSALDVAHQLHVLGLLRDTTARRGLVTVAVLHDLNAAARFAGRIALIRQGRLLACGVPADVLTPPLIRDAFGVHASVLPGPDGFPVVVPLRAADFHHQGE